MQLQTALFCSGPSFLSSPLPHPLALALLSSFSAFSRHCLGLTLLPSGFMPCASLSVQTMPRSLQTDASISKASEFTTIARLPSPISCHRCRGSYRLFSARWLGAPLECRSGKIVWVLGRRSSRQACSVILGENGVPIAIMERATTCCGGFSEIIAETHLRLLMEQMPVAFWTADLRLQITSIGTSRG